MLEPRSPEPVTPPIPESPLEAVLLPQRSRLPDTRRSVTHKFNINGYEGYVTVGLYHDGRPGELFIKMAKQGSTLSGFADAIGILTSLSLQYGVPLDVLATKLQHMRFEPSGWTPNKQIPHAHSIVDYIFRWMTVTFADSDSSPLED